jgi:hypothetical protein
MHMRISTRYQLLLVLAILGLLALACGSFAPPEACPSSGSDTEAFPMYFNDMQVVNAATGAPGEDDPETDQGVRFSASDELAIRVDSVGEVEVTFCITERKGGGQIVYNQAHTLPAGESTVPLMAFDSDPYVVRVIVNEVVVRNLTFFTE